MKFKNLVDFHKKLAAKLGKDLVYSLALDEGEIFLVISTHKSKTKRYKDKPFKTMQSCKIRANEFDMTLNQIVAEVVKAYSPILEDYEPARNNGEQKEST